MHSKKLATKTQKKRKPLAPERKEWCNAHRGKKVELELLTDRDEDRMQVFVFALKVSCRWFPPTISVHPGDNSILLLLLAGAAQGSVLIAWRLV